MSVTDLNLVLGRLNPDYFLGGEVELDVERRARRSSARSRGRSGSTVEAAAAGVIELFEQTLKNEAVGRILGKGYSPADYTLLCYGGGGPLHVAGYTEGVTYAEVLVPAWAAGFSAFGCACADFDYRYDQTVDMPLLPTFGDAGTGRHRGDDHRLPGWACRTASPRSSRSPGSGASSIRFTHAVRMQYYGQLNDIEFVSPHAALEDASQVDDLIATFEDAYAKMYASSARSPEFGYLVTHVIVHGTVDVEKPALPQLPEEPGKPPLKAITAGPLGPRQRGASSSRPRSSSSSRWRPATRSRARRSSSTRRPPSRYRPDAERRSTRTTSSTSPTRRDLAHGDH